MTDIQTWELGLKKPLKKLENSPPEIRQKKTAEQAEDSSPQKIVFAKPSPH